MYSIVELICLDSVCRVSQVIPVIRDHVVSRDPQVLAEREDHQDLQDKRARG